MINRKVIAAFALGALISLGGSALIADQNSSSSYTSDRVLVREYPDHWTHQHIESLKAEENVEQSIYLSAVQRIQMERDQGDVLKVIPELERLADSCPTQPLRNAIRRLIVDLHLEAGEYKYAEQQLNTIIDESLAQIN